MADSVQIRRATAVDIPQIAGLFRAELAREPDIPKIASWVGQYPAVTACTPDGTLVGFCYSNSFAPDIIELDNILVARTWRNQQIGARLLLAFEQCAAEHFKGIILVNSMLYKTAGAKRPAVTFYLRHGYTVALQTEASCVFVKPLPARQER
jgi:GNAT superfamily N-acetyltransferase